VHRPEFGGVAMGSSFPKLLTGLFSSEFKSTNFFSSDLMVQLSNNVNE